MLSTFVDENRRDWDDHLPYVMAAYRSTFHKSTGLGPNLMMLNREMNLPIDLMVGPIPEGGDKECPIQYVEWVKNATINAYEFAYGQLGIAASRQKHNYERGLKPRQFEKGNWVWRWYPPAAGVKFGLGWVGPYLVVRCITRLEYVIQKSKDGKQVPVHVDDLKPFVGQNHPKSWLNEDLPHEAYDSSDSECDHYVNSGIQTPDDPPDPMITQTTPTVQKTKSGCTIKPRKIYSP